MVTSGVYIITICASLRRGKKSVLGNSREESHPKGSEKRMKGKKNGTEEGNGRGRGKEVKRGYIHAMHNASMH